MTGGIPVLLRSVWSRVYKPDICNICVTFHQYKDSWHHYTCSVSALKRSQKWILYFIHSNIYIAVQMSCLPHGQTSVLCHRSWGILLDVELSMLFSTKRYFDFLPFTVLFINQLYILWRRLLRFLLLLLAIFAAHIATYLMKSVTSFFSRKKNKSCFNFQVTIFVVLS